MPSIEKFLEQHFASHDWTWSLKGRGMVQPTEEDIANALDEASKILYSEENVKAGNNTLMLGRLIIVKNEHSLDVYVLAGTI